MDTVLQATVYRIKTYQDNTKQLTDDLDYTNNSIAQQETKSALIDDKLIQTCFELFDNTSLSPSHLVEILKIIQKLAVLYSARKLIIAEKQLYIEQICQLLSSKDENVRLNACKLVTIICFFEDSINTISHSKITEILYDLLFDSNYNIISETLQSLSYITNYIRVCPEKVVQKMIQILSSTDKSDVKRCESNLKCLWNICTTWQMKEIAIKHQIVVSLSKFLSTTYAKQESTVCRCASGLLMPISVCESGKEAIISATNIITSLCYLVSNKHIHLDIQNNSGIVLQNISDHSKGLLIIGKELIHKHQLLIQLFGNDKAAQIAQYYMNKDDNQLMQQSAVGLLALVAQQKNNGIDAVWKCLNIVPELIDIFMMTEKDRTIALALDCIIMLCQSQETAQIILRKEARRSQAFYSTANKIEQLQPFLAPHLM